MEDLREALRRELDLNYDPPSLRDLGSLQAAFPDLYFDEVDGTLVQVLLTIAGPTRPGHVSVADARACDIEAEVDDELLFPLDADQGYAADAPLAEALLGSGVLYRTERAAEHRAFLDLLQSCPPRAVQPRPLPWSGHVCDRASFGWSTVLVGRSIVVRGLSGARARDLERELAAASARLGVPLGALRLGLDGVWHIGAYLFGCSHDHPLGPWATLGLQAVLDRLRTTLDARLWDALAQCMGASESWREPEVSVLLGSAYRGASLAQGTLALAPACGDPAWSRAVEAGDLVLMHDDTIADPHPFILRGHVKASAEPDTTTVVDLATLDETLPVYLLPGASQPQARGRPSDALHAHAIPLTPLPPWQHTPAMPDAVVAAQSLLRQRKDAATRKPGWAQAVLGRLGKKAKPTAPPLRACLDAYETVTAYLEPRFGNPFRPPADDADLERVAALGTLPEALVELYRWHDGHHDAPGASPLFELGTFCSIREGLEHRQVCLDVRDDFQPTWHVIGHNGSGDVLVLQLAPGPDFGKIAFWDHEADNTHLAFETSLDDELAAQFDLLATYEAPTRARWLPTGLAAPPRPILPDALRWTDPTALQHGTTVITGRDDSFRAWLWWPEAYRSRWLHASCHATPEGALAQLCTAMRDRPLNRIDEKDHNAMVSEMLEHGATPTLLLCTPAFTPAPNG